MFVAGLLMLAVAVGMIVAGIAVPMAAVGLIAGGVGVGLGGLLLAYLDAPSRRRPVPPGSLSARATILDAAVLPGAVAGYQMVELTLEVRPRDGVPFQVKRRFSSGRFGRIEQGQRIDVVYDPADPEKLDLA